jgi:hypothetical protein
MPALSLNTAGPLNTAGRFFFFSQKDDFSILNHKIARNEISILVATKEDTSDCNTAIEREFHPTHEFANLF